VAALGSLLVALFPMLATVIRWLGAATAGRSRAAAMPWATVPPAPEAVTDRPHGNGKRRAPSPARSADSGRVAVLSGLGFAVGWLAACWMILMVSAAMFDGSGVSLTGDSYDAVPSGGLVGSVIAMIGTIILWRRRIGKSGLLAGAVFALTLVGAAGIALFMVGQF
jgi:nitrate reductase gamma subunit